jgi:hypothetical protein
MNTNRLRSHRAHKIVVFILFLFVDHKITAFAHIYRRYVVWMTSLNNLDPPPPPKVFQCLPTNDRFIIFLLTAVTSDEHLSWISHNIGLQLRLNL